MECYNRVTVVFCSCVSPVSHEDVGWSSFHCGFAGSPKSRFYDFWNIF